MKEIELADAQSKIVQMKSTLTKVLSAQTENAVKTASTMYLEEDQSYFSSYSSVDIHYEMLMVKINF